MTLFKSLWELFFNPIAILSYNGINKHVYVDNNIIYNMLYIVICYNHVLGE